MDEGRFTIRNTFRDIGQGLLVAVFGFTAAILMARAGVPIRNGFFAILSIFLAGYAVWTLKKGSYPVYLLIGFWTRVYVVTRAEMPRRYWLGVALNIAVAIYFAGAAFGLLPFR